MPEKIQQKKVMAVEGNDEVNFFKSLLEHTGITDVEVFEAGGKDQFKNKLPALIRRKGFSEVETLAIIRDAEENAGSAFDSIINILKKENLKPPSKVNEFSQGIPRIGIFIMPGNSDEGMLEDLCLQTVENHPVMKCVEAFIDCVKKSGNQPGNIAKAKAQAFLAAMPEIVKSVGLGARKNYWDFNSSVMADLNTFINMLET